MLIAIAIYQDNRMSFGGFQLMVAAQQKSPLGLFGNSLVNIDFSLNKLPEFMELTPVYNIVIENEFHYFKKIQVDDPEDVAKKQDLIIAIISRKRLDMQPNGSLASKEKYYLFKNIEHIYLRQELVKKSLDDVIANPYYFIGKDIHINSLQQELIEIKEIAIDNMSKMLDRGEMLNKIQPKSFMLYENTKKFKSRAEDLNKCCVLL